MANKWCSEKLPVGAIRIRKRVRGTRCRFIKISNRGPSGTQWKRLARWWWEQNVGPVPPGVVVAHLDGDSLNDDPANYGLRTLGQVAQVQHEIDPNMSLKNRAKCRAATIARNRLAGQIARRTFRFAANHWYLVDPSAREILDRVFRSRRRALSHLGIEISANGRKRVACVVQARRGREMSELRSQAFRVVDCLRGISREI